MNNLMHTNLMNITARPELVFVKGQGSWLWDSSGKRYLDFVQGWAVNTLGHAPACITQALLEQSSRLISPSPAYYNEPSIKLAELLCANSCFEQVFFTNSGAEANEGAIKLARKWGQKHRNGAFEIITFTNAFHGRTLATMSASGKPGWDTLFAPQVPGFPKASLNDLASVTRLINANTVAIMLEPIQGEAGVLCASQSFLQELRSLCDQRKMLLIFDEIQTGMGRLGRFFGHELFGVEPDIMTLAKGIGGGVPLGALLAQGHACVFEHGDQGGTYNGNPLMTAVGLAVTQAIQAPGFLDQVTRNGEYLAQTLRQISSRLKLGEVRGAGLLQALELGGPHASKVASRARENGLLLNAPRPSVLRFMPALTTSAEEIDQMAQLLTDAIQ